MKTTIVTIATTIILSIFSAQSFANDNKIKWISYIGFGEEYEEKHISGVRPWSVGILQRVRSNSSLFFGVDIAGEGKLINNTSRKNDVVEQSLSLNFGVASHKSLNHNWGRTFGFLLGVRDSEEKCPDSYIGYQCYADKDPKMKREFNYGVILNYNYKNLSIGTRISGESSQATLGIVF